MKKGIAILLAVAMLLSLSACAGKRNDADEPPAEETVSGPYEGEAAAEPEAAPAEAGKRVLRIGTIENSHSYSPTSDAQIDTLCVYEAVVRYNPDGSLSPWCAESVEWLDELTLRIKVRDGVTFQNGEPMLGEDVFYSFYLVSHSAGVWADKFSCINFDESYVEDDGMTVIFKLDRVYTPLEMWLGKVNLTDKSEVADRPSDDETWWDHPVCSGAYEIVENVSQSHLTLRLREDYWDKENMPEWDEIQFHYFSNSTAMFIAFENGELDVAVRVDPNDYERLLAGDVKNADVAAYQLVSWNCAQFLVLGGYKEEFQDINVRRAVAHALDANAIGLIAYGALCEGNLDSVLSKSVKYYEPQGVYEYDVELAKEYMAQSAYPDGFTVNVMANTTEMEMWEVIQAELAEIGITLSVSSYDFSTLLGFLLKEGGTDLCTFGSSNFAKAASDTFSAYYDGNGLACSRILDPAYNEMFDKTLVTTDEEELARLYSDMQAWNYENCWLIPLVEPSYCVAYDSSVTECHFMSHITDYPQYNCEAVP